MNNDNLKRILNKISGASQQQSEDPSVFDILEQERLAHPNEKERIETFCTCLYGLMNNATATSEGWDAQLKSITTSCIHHLFRPGFDVISNGIDAVTAVAIAGRVCSSFALFATYTSCRIRCEKLGYIKNTVRFSKCVQKCTGLGPRPPFINRPAMTILDPLGALPFVRWEIEDRSL
jgi:hypothetical protein